MRPDFRVLRSFAVQPDTRIPASKARLARQLPGTCWSGWNGSLSSLHQSSSSGPSKFQHPTPDPAALDRCWSGPGVLRLPRPCTRKEGPRMPRPDPSPFDVLEAAFRLLTSGPEPVSLDGRVVGQGLPARPINLDELRQLLLHPSVGFAARDAAVAWLARHARDHGG